MIEVTSVEKQNRYRGSKSNYILMKDYEDKQGFQLEEPNESFTIRTETLIMKVIRAKLTKELTKCHSI